MVETVRESDCGLSLTSVPFDAAVPLLRRLALAPSVRSILAKSVWASWATSRVKVQRRDQEDINPTPKAGAMLRARV